MSTVRKELVWCIKKKLFRLSSSHIYQVARDIASNSQDKDQPSLNDEESCIEYVISYMQSDTLLGLEDEGVGQLMMLNDLLSRVIETCASVDLSVDALSDVRTHVTPSHSPSTTIPGHASQPHSHSNNTAIQPMSHSNIHVNTNIQSAEELRKVYEELGEKLRQCESTVTPPAATYNHQVESVLHPTSERLVALKDISYLQRREFKVHGDQIEDQSSDIT